MTRLRHAGFTFIEVLVAMAIFVMAVIAAINITTGSVQATRDAREVSEATWLLQQKMVQLETKLETEGVEKACEKKDDGKFEGHDRFTWKSSCDEVDFKISETAAQMTGGGSEDEESKNTQENMILKFILKTASDYITQSVREVHVEVNWTSGKIKRMVDLTTHFVRYDQKVSIAGLGGGGGGGKPTDPADTGGGAGGTTQ